MSVKNKTTLIRDLLYLRDIIVYGGISAAAAKSGIKPSNLSTCIHQLEERFGTRLLSRHSRGVAPTPYTLTILSDLDALDDIVSTIEKRCPQMTHSENITVYLPENLIIDGLFDFAKENGIIIENTPIERSADVMISYHAPDPTRRLIVVENTIGTAIRQNIWVSAVDRPETLNLARFIISKLHSA